MSEGHDQQVYEFTFRRRIADSRGVPLTGLPRLVVTTVTVRAADESTARAKAQAASGPAGTGRDSYQTWSFELVAISEVAS